MEATRKSRVGVTRLREPKPREKTTEDWARELLDEASSQLESHWIRNSLSDGHGNYCAVGVLNMTYKSNKKFPRGRMILAAAKKLLARSIESRDFTRAYDAENTIIEFNDSEAKDETEVIRKFKEASAGK